MTEKKYNYFYKTTNLINRKYYYGIHSTNNIDDNYLGSGIILLKAIKKYGKENFRKEIIVNFQTRKEASDYEKSIVTLELLDLDECYNGRTGGDNEYIIPVSDEKRQKLKESRSRQVFTEETRKKMSDSAKKRDLPEEFIKNIGSWADPEKHPSRFPISDEVRQKISKSLTGIKRSTETRKKMSESFKHRILSEENKKQISETLREYYKNNKNSRFGKSSSDETKKKISKSSPHKKPCIIEGNYFESKVAVCKFYSLSITTVSDRIKSDREKWKNWNLLNKDYEP